MQASFGVWVWRASALLLVAQTNAAKAEEKAPAVGPAIGPAVGYVVGARNAEDLVAVPGTRWIVTSGLESPGLPGGLFLIDRESKAVQRLFPSAAVLFREDAAAYPGCPGPLATLSAHGISLRRGKGGVDTLYVVNHSGREAIEVFALDRAADHSGGAPTLTWTGCVPLPAGSLGNGVAPISTGGIAATLMNVPEYFTGPAGADHPEAWIPKLSSGQTTGYAARWRAGEGWKKIAGTAGSGPNGIETSPDGRWVYVALWGNRQIVRAPLPGGGEPNRGQRSVIKVDFMPDNLRWGDDGRLWIGGAAGAQADYFACWAKPGCRNDYSIARLDPASLTVESVAHPETRPTFGEATSAVRIGGAIWIGAHPSDRVAYLPFAP